MSILIFNKVYENVLGNGKEIASYSGDIGFFVKFGEISYLVTNKKNTNNQELGLIQETSLKRV
jgi:hypothetical protein